MSDPDEKPEHVAMTPPDKVAWGGWFPPIVDPKCISLGSPMPEILGRYSGEYPLVIECEGEGWLTGDVTMSKKHEHEKHDHDDKPKHEPKQPPVKPQDDSAPPPQGDPPGGPSTGDGG